MANRSDTVRIVYEGDSAGAVRAAEAVTRSMDNVDARAARVGANVGGLGNIFQNALSFAGGGAILGVVQGAVSGLADLGRSVVDTGFNFNNLKEQASIAFNTIFQDAQKAKDFVASIATFATQTPFEFPQLLDAAKRLTSVGVEASRVIPIMRTLGDATAAMGTGAFGIQRATLALQQMATLGRVTGTDILQLTQAGIPAWDALAASMGVSVSKAQELVSKGLVGAEQMFRALETGAGESLQRVKGMMAAQAKSFEGTFSTLKDNIAQAAGKITEPLFNAVRDGMTGLNEIFASPEFAEGVADFSEQIAGGIQTAIGTLSNLIPTIQSIFNQFAQSNLGDALTTQFGAIATVVTVTLLPALMQAATWIQTNLLPAFLQFAQWLGNVVLPAVVNISGAFMQWFLPALVQVGTIVGSVLAPVLQTLIGILQNQVGPALEKIGGVLNTTVFPALGALADWLGPKIVPLLTALSQLIGVTLIGAFQLLALALQRIINDFVNFVNTLGAGIGKVKEIFVDILGGIQQFYNFIGDKNTAAGIGISINALNKGFTALGATINTAIDTGTRYSRVLKDDIVTGTDSATRGILSEGDALKKQNAEAYKAAQAAKNAGNAFQDLGNKAIGGANNVKAAADVMAKVADKVRGMVESALTATSVDERLKMTGDAWDEFRLRLEAVTSGTPLDAYGDAFTEQVKKMQAITGLALPDIATKFKDFSLFARMDWLKAALETGAVDLTPIRDRIKQQIDQLVGFANLAKAAFDEIWTSLDAGAKLDLAKALGLDASAANVEGLKTQIQGAVTGAMTGVGDAGAAALQSGLSKASDAAGALGKNISDKVSGALPTLKSNIETIAVPALEGLKEKLDGGVNTSVGTLATNLNNSLVATRDIHTPLETMQTDVGKLSEKLNEVSPTFKAFLDNVLKPIGNTLSEMLETTLKLVDAMNSLAEALAKTKPNPQFESHSPSPFEQTLKNIYGYMGGIKTLAPNMLAGLAPNGGLGYTLSGGALSPQSAQQNTAARNFYNHGTIVVQSNDVDDMLMQIEERLGRGVNIRRRNRE